MATFTAGATGRRRSPTASGARSPHASGHADYMPVDAVPMASLGTPKPINRGELLEQIDRRRQHLSFFIMFVALFGVLVAIIEVECLWHNNNVPTFGLQCLKLFGSVTTLALFYFLLRYYTVEFEILEASGKSVIGASYVQSFVLSGLWKPLLIDCVVVLIHPLPFVNTTIAVWGMGKYTIYSSDSFLCALMASRVFVFMPRLIAELSGLKNEKTRLVGMLNHVKVDFFFVLRVMLRDSLTVLLSIFLVSVFTLAYCMVLFERPVHDTELHDFENSIWLMIITMTTVGYGDTYPRTPCGRAIAVIASFFAIVFVALAVTAVTDRLSLSRDEEKLLDFLANIEKRRERKGAGVTLIQRSWAAYKKFKHVGVHDPSRGPLNRVSSSPLVSQAALAYQEEHQGTGSISTDVALTTTETCVQLRRLQGDVTAMKKVMEDSSRLLKSLSGGARTQSVRF